MAGVGLDNLEKRKISCPLLGSEYLFRVEELLNITTLSYENVSDGGFAIFCNDTLINHLLGSSVPWLLTVKSRGNEFKSWIKTNSPEMFLIICGNQVLG